MPSMSSRVKATWQSSRPPSSPRQLAGVHFKLHDAADMALDAEQLAGFSMSDALLGMLIVVLISEQLFGYLASFHVAPLRGGSR